MGGMVAHTGARRRSPASAHLLRADDRRSRAPLASQACLNTLDMELRNHGHGAMKAWEEVRQDKKCIRNVMASA